MPRFRRDERWNSSILSGLHPALLPGACSEFTICDHDISESLEHLAQASNAFYFSHVALLFLFKQVFKMWSLYISCKNELKAKLFTNDILKTLDIISHNQVLYSILHLIPAVASGFCRMQFNGNIKTGSTLLGFVFSIQNIYFRKGNWSVVMCVCAVLYCTDRVQSCIVSFLNGSDNLWKYHGTSLMNPVITHNIDLSQILHSSILAEVKLEVF